MYLSGPTGRDYLETEKFAHNGIALRFASFQHPVYRQRYPGFEPNMSAIDLLFNLGPQAEEIVKRAAMVEAYPK
ncbi:MAG: WbqC family protein [Chloroflexi bacterium]|nr:WbqC family protein [Chloroflexota bacterium]